MQVGNKLLGALEGKSKNAPGQDAFLALHDNARRDAIPFFERARGGPLGNQNGFTAADQVARARKDAPGTMALAS